MVALPPRVALRVLDRETMKPAVNVAFLLTLYAHRKNNYSVGPFVSDNQGVVAISKEDCLKSIDASQQLALMDYASSLTECLPKISIELMSPENLEYFIENSRKFRDIYSRYWDCSEETLGRLEACDNGRHAAEIFTFSEDQLHESQPLTVLVRKTRDVPDSTP